MSTRLRNIFSRDPEIYVSTLLGATELDDRCILFAANTGIVNGNFNFWLTRISKVRGNYSSPAPDLEMIGISNADADEVTARIQTCDLEVSVRIDLN